MFLAEPACLIQEELPLHRSGDVDDSNLSRLFRECFHCFFCTRLIALDQAIAGKNDLLITAEIHTHPVDSGILIAPIKGQHGFRHRASESVNALVVVSHHEQAVPSPVKLLNNRVLEQRGVLCLVHADIRILPLPESLRGGIIQHFQRVNQHIVKIHLRRLMPRQFLLISFVYRPNADRIVHSHVYR